MKTFTKHILLLALMLFGVAGAAWADRAPQKFTGPVDIDNLVQGDTLAPGFSLTCNGESIIEISQGNAKIDGGDPTEWDLFFNCALINDFSYGPNGAIIVGPNTATPVDANGQDGNAWVVTSTYSDEHYTVTLGGITIAPDPYVPALDELTGNWNFLMPGANKVVKVTYKAEPDLAWTFGGRAIPNDTTITAYRGFELPVIGNIGAIMNHDFYTALLGGTVSLRYGSTNPAVISFTNPNNMYSFSVNGAGECDVYMVFDGNDDFQDDSVAFHAVIAEPATLTLAKEGNGTVSALLGGGSATWTTETWANLPTDQNLSPLTFGDITISTTGSMAINSSYNPGKLSFFVSQFDDAKTLTFSSEGGNFSRIEMTMISEYSQYNPSIIPADGWTFDGYTAVWEGDAPSVTVTSCSTYVSQITFTRGIDSIVVLDEAAGTYLVIPGATVQVVATAQDGNHVQGWNEIDKVVTNLLSDTATIVVNQSQTLTANFAQNPVLTLEANNSEWGTVTLDGMTYDTVYNITFDHHTSSEGSRTFTIPASRLPYDTTFNYSDYVQAADADAPSGKLSISNRGDNTVTIRISGAFEGNGTYVCIADDYDEWSITCTATSIVPVTPDGVTAGTAANTYRVLPGTEVNVTATPDSAHYLSRIDGHDTVSNHACGYSFVMPDSDYPLMADFTTKPTLTLAQTDGGTLEAIVPEGGVTAMHPTTDQIPTWDGNTEYAMAADLQQFGFVAVDSAAAAAWTGVPASGDIILVYALAGNQFKAILFQDGQWHGTYTSNFYKGEIYSYTNSDIIYFTTGVSKSNVIASSTPNTYYIDYGTPVTVVATPDAQHYLVSFSDDDPATELNSNIAVEKTYDSVINDIPNLSATFQAKPTLTLAQTDGGTLTVEGAGSAGGEVTIGNGTETTSVTPYNSLWEYSFVESLYTAEEIGTAGTITSVSYHLRENDEPQTSDFVIYMKNVSRSTFASGTDYEPVTDADIVYSGSVTFNPGWTTITLGTPFEYDGTSNLMIAFDENIPGFITRYFYYTDNAGKVVSYHADNYNPDPYNLGSYAGNKTVSSNRANIKLDIAPAATAIVALSDTTYRVDYGTDVTVVATPDSIHYLATLGEELVNSNDSIHRTFTMTAPVNLPADFRAKPTLTLVHNDGGEMEVMPAGGVTAMHLTTDQIPTWPEVFEPVTEANLQPFGFVAVDSAAAAAWTGAPASGQVILVYAPAGNQFKAILFQNGQWYDAYTANFFKGEIYANSDVVYFTTGATPSNVIATAEPNTYYIDYNTSVTVKATPSDTTYLVRFVGDAADTNSNTAVEKTYGPLTAALTTAEATFNDKPVLTLAKNENWGTVSVSGPVVWNNQVWGSWDMINTTFPQTIGDITINKNNFYCYYSFGKLYLHRSVDNNSFVTFTSAGDNFTRIEMTYTAGTNLEPANEWTCANGVAVWEGNAQNVTITNANGFDITQIKFIRGSGVEQLTDNTYRVDYGTEVTVKADATELHHVANWVNEDSVAYPADSITYSAYFITDPVTLFPDSSTLTITVTADTTTKAIFGINSYDVFATAELDSRANVGTDTSMGHINVSFIDIEGDAQTVDPTDTIEITAQGGSLTTLVAKPHYGYLFTGWYDADADTIMTDADTLRITEAYKLEARFVPDTFEIVLTNRQPRFGTVALNNYTQEETNSDATSVTERYAYRDSIILSVEPIYGYHFNNWNDNDTNNPRGFQLTQDTAFAAIISINRYQVHFGVADGQENYGTVEANYPVHYVCNHGYTAFFKAIAAEGYHFVEWSNGLTDDSVSFRIIQDTDMVATFAPNEYSVVALCNAEQGSTTGTDSYYFGTTATITATAEYGYHFTAWSDGDTNAERTIAIDFTHDTTVTALFAPDQYTVTVLSSDSTMGSVSGTGTYDYLTQVEIAATANEHYYFLQWDDNSTDADSATRTVTVTEDAIYTALFAADTHTLTLASNNAIMGSISLVAPAGLIPNEDGSYTIAYGTEVTVKATASNRCFELGNWGTSDTTLSTDSIYTFTMEGDLALKATFANHLFTSDTVVDVCDRFVWNGVTYTETPEVAPMRNYTTTDGCDSALVLNLTVRHSSTEGLYVSACNSYSWYEYTDMTYSQSVSHTFEGANVEGCDSIVTLYLTIGDVAITNLYVDTCDSYTWKDVTYTETPEVAPSYTYHTAANCDSIVTLYLTIGHPSAGVETIVACSAIEWHDSLYSESTNEPVWHTTNVSGCDSTVTLNLTITPEIATVETVEACDSYEWHDSVYTASTDSATYTATSIHGCDSTVTLHLTINHSNTAVETVEACNEYEWHEVVYTESTNLPTYTTTNAAGCDSTVTLNLTIKESASAIETVEACDEYKWHDSTYTESTNLPTYTTEGSNGCDSVTTLNLTINHSTNVTVTVTACDSYEWHDSVYTETPAEAPVYITEGSNGCDSVTTLMLTVATSGSSEETVEACDEYTWINDSTYTETPAEDPVYTIAGDNCSTTVTLHLTIKHSVESSFDDNACVGYAWSGNYYEESGVYTKTFEAENGCDSVVTLTLTVNQPVFNSIEAEACGSYEWNNQTYVASGVYRQTLEAENGCDSVVTLTLTVKQAASTSFSITVCDSYTWNDSVYTASGVYTQTFEGVNGCDSTVTLNLTVNTNAGVEQTVEACDSYLWNGQTYTTSGNYSVSFTDGNNCVGDSVLHLTVNASASENVEETVCDRYTWNGNTYTASGVYTYHTSTVAGCDSTVTLTLTVNYSDSIDMSVTACDSYTWNDGDSATYTESGVYTYNYTTEGQCAGVKTLTLTINNSTTGSETVEACNYYVWKNNTYSNSGDYTFDTVNAAGCDSTVTLHLTIKYEAYTPISMTVCDSYEWNGEVYTHSGVFNQFFEAENGCDSVVGLTLTVNHSTTGSEIVSSCTAYEWNGQTYYESGVYTFDTVNAVGCDSTVSLLLNILQGVQTNVVENACDSYTWNDAVYTESGVYNQAFLALNGCDSIVTLNLTINNSVSTEQAVSSCVSYDWNNQTYTESGVYTQVLTARNGCDSTVTLTLTINQPATETVTVETCDGYDWNGVYYTVSGVYTYRTSTVAGCDSTVTLNLTVNYSDDTTLTMQGEGRITWNNEVFTESGRYERVLSTVHGCDSTVTLNLSILPEGMPMPYLYNLMDVALMINHNEAGSENVHYVWYRWYRDGELVLEGPDKDSYSEGGSKLNGCYYLEVATDESLEYWVRSNTVCVGTVGIDEAEELSFTIAPNPVTYGSVVNVAVEAGNADLQGAEIHVYDVHGREVLSQKNNGYIVAELPSGMYMVRLTLSDGRTGVKRLIVR